VAISFVCIGKLSVIATNVSTIPATTTVKANIALNPTVLLFLKIEIIWGIGEAVKKTKMSQPESFPKNVGYKKTSGSMAPYKTIENKQLIENGIFDLKPS